MPKHRTGASTDTARADHAADVRRPVLARPQTPRRTPTHDGGDRLVDLVFAWIADQIVVGNLGPGQWISEITVAQELGVSRSPVHQALQALSALHVVSVT